MRCVSAVQLRGVDKVATFMCRLSENPGSFNFREPSGPVRASIRVALLLSFIAAILKDMINATHVP